MTGVRWNYWGIGGFDRGKAAKKKPREKTWGNQKKKDGGGRKISVTVQLEK